MNRRWMTTLCLPLALAACQVATSQDPTSTADQEISGTYCGVAVPTPVYWQGGPVQKAQPGQVYLLYRDPQGSTDWIAMFADTNTDKLLSALRVKESGVGSLLTTIQLAGQIDVGRVVPPHPQPGPIGTGAFLMNWAHTAATMQGDLENNSVCP